MLAAVYCGWFYFLGSLTGAHRLDGIIGVILGLYICSHPSANAVNMLFFERGTLREYFSSRSGIGWLALNLVVMLAGCLVIVVGTIQLVIPND